METIHIIIAEMSPLARLGITGLLKSMGYPFSVREVIHAGKLKHTLYKDHKYLLIISGTFINSCNPEHFQTLLMKGRHTSRVFIHDTEITHKAIPDFNEIIEPEDPEKVIYRKLEKQVAALSKSGPYTGRTDEISYREKEVLQLVALGMTNKEIAEKLYISSHTVITHRKNITSKLGIKTIAGLTVYAVIHKLIAPGSIR